ncbi:carboxyl transferase domain-containing protein [Anaeromassilibacillus senegalensis]|uniref:carboxyl transferase domain-containing protein n=1 Tax=Anaeromassilibacillus senegalensis TaxID=1673717 RepID=UPI00067F950C|nr:carboxyl transferase domain-containing protein [Anaeromassilibacillus senegalensis]
MSTGNSAELLQTSREAAAKTKGFQRITALFDEGTFNEVDSFAKSGDGSAEVVAGYGEINGSPVYAFVQNSDVDGGAMSRAQAAKIKKIYDLAVKTGSPVVGIYDSIGGRLNQGADMLAAYGEILLGNNNLSGVVPQISLVLGPCIGTSAMIAASADFVVMAEKAELTIETSGKDGAAENAAKMGVCSILAKDDKAAMEQVRKLIAVLPSNNLSGAPVFEDAGNASAAIPNGADAKKVIAAISDTDSFVELNGQFGTAAVAGLSLIGGATVGVVAYNGVLDADACSKAARFVRFCDAFSIPVVTLVDAKEFSSVREAAKLSNSYSEATTAKITVITGEAYGPVYVAVAGRGANADYTMAWANAVVCPLAPQTAAMFLWSDRLKKSGNTKDARNKLIEEYKATEATPFAAAAEGYIEDIIRPEETRARLIANLEMLDGKRVSRLPKKHSNIQI